MPGLGDEGKTAPRAMYSGATASYHASFSNSFRSLQPEPNQRFQQRGFANTLAANQADRSRRARLVKSQCQADTWIAP